MSEYVNDRTGEVCTPSSDDEDGGYRGPVYEATPCRFKPLRSSVAAPSVCSCCGGAGTDRFGVCPLCDGHGSLQDDDEHVERMDLWSSGSDSAFLLKNLLSAARCDEIIAQAEAFGFRDCGYSRKVRVTDRVSVMGEKLGQLLFERTRPYLADVFMPGLRDRPEGVPEDLLRGLWKPAGLNPCFRACRYSPGGFFLPHHDGGFDVSDERRSIKTFMLYLNDDFEGGPTNFYTEDQRPYLRGLPQNKIYSLRPEKGSCLVFNHCITHDGGELVRGSKYILRTEVMYCHQ